MDEKRMNKRVPVHMHLTIESLYKSGETEKISISEEITVTNISKRGIGFLCSSSLPLDHYFNAKIKIDEEKTFYCVLKIVRCKKINQGYQIGCEFIGLANILGKNIDLYVEEIEEGKE